MWFSFGQNVLAPLRQPDVPSRLENLELADVVEGSEALAQVNRLHGTDIRLESAYIAQYVQGNERGTVWVGKAESKDDAAELLDSMVMAIGKGSSVFSNLQRLSIANHEVFQIDGPGGKHFFYTSKKTEEQVVWLILEVTDALSVLEEAVEDF